MRKSGLSFLRSFGQNFVVSTDVVDRIVKFSGITDRAAVLEVGTGLGALTEVLCKVSSYVISVEIDEGLFSAVKNQLKKYVNLHIINKDFLKLNLEELWAVHFRGLDVFICANLPYYIASSIIVKILRSRVKFKSLTVMIQREMAQRICAPVGSKRTGPLSVFVNYFCEAEYLFTVARENFFPVPNVESAVIKLTRRVTPKVSVLDEDLLFRIVKQSFLKRRKMLSNSLVPFSGVPKSSALEVLSKLGIKTLRPENLTLEQFACISNHFSKIMVT